MKPLVFDGTPALPGYRGNRTPLVHRGRHRSRVGSFPEVRPVLGEVTETLCAAGTEDLGRTGCGCFPRARVPLRKWVLSPGETYPGESAFYARQLFPGRGLNMYIG